MRKRADPANQLIGQSSRDARPAVSKQIAELPRVSRSILAGAFWTQRAGPQGP